ncbi:MAG: amidophosphoribosyltransferase [Micavibrio aeruginosavorus]|uniref:Amidophosphoribosyltransferase n=1 Tax=Micavibrio aeruginosavorus TaxID=349221 RepID=A0A7T5R353_9BACT|nr:MAG: amidophosphoribosyltransferase [Micavibrio aeruginosavorus]
MNKDDQDHVFDDDKLKEECGVFAVFGHGDAATLTALGLHALQHRGQEATGIVSHDGTDFFAHRALGLVDKAFGDAETIIRLRGHAAIGHNRYATTGEGSVRNIQPLFADLSFGGFAIAHNGNLTNAHTLRMELVNKGALFQSTTDTEVILHLMAVSQKKAVQERLIDALARIEGAYSLVACCHDQVIGVRDPLGFRPLVLGRLGPAYILASETCALDIIGADFVRDIEPGEMVVIDEKGMRSTHPFAGRPSRFCVFEYIYFARPDSALDGRSVYESRKKIGAELAREAPCPDADVVVPVPDSGVPAAIGYAEASGLPFELGIIRNHYVGRTFIEPTDQIRHLGVKLKHNANRAYIEGKKIVLVDDSIVRGTTSKKIVEMLRAAGAKEVHMRISSPPTAHSCFYGIDTPSTTELLANRMNVSDIREYIGVDSLSYISIDGLYKAMGEAGRDSDNPAFCDACFTGDYPVALTDHTSNCSGSRVTDLRERVTRRT